MTVLDVDRWIKARLMKKWRGLIVTLAHKFETRLLVQKGETMNEIKQGENEPLEHYELRHLLQEAKAIVLPMDSDQRKKWVAESRLAQEIYTILVQHLQYYEEFRTFVGGIFPEPIR
jgi:hypothetical protein